MKRLSLMVAAATCLLAGIVSSAQADTITSLYNTGVNSAGVSLANGTVGDPHYTLVSVPGGTTSLLVRTSAGGYPVGPYIGDSATSAWIGPGNDAALNSPVGDYTFRTTFDLTGFLAGTAKIVGGWSTDNTGVGIFLNGVDTGNPSTSFTQFSQGFASFTISSGFVAGVNTLDFVVRNGQLNPGNNTWNPAALRVEMTGTAVAVPAPGGLTMAGTFGAMGLVFVAIRRRRQQAQTA